MNTCSSKQLPETLIDTNIFTQIFKASNTHLNDSLSEVEIDSLPLDITVDLQTETQGSGFTHLCNCTLLPTHLFSQRHKKEQHLMPPNKTFDYLRAMALATDTS